MRNRTKRNIYKAILDEWRMAVDEQNQRRFAYWRRQHQRHFDRQRELQNFAPHSNHFHVSNFVDANRPLSENDLSSFTQKIIEQDNFNYAGVPIQTFDTRSESEKWLDGRISEITEYAAYI